MVEKLNIRVPVTPHLVSHRSRWEYKFYYLAHLWAIPQVGENLKEEVTPLDCGSKTWNCPKQKIKPFRGRFVISIRM